MLAIDRRFRLIMDDCQSDVRPLVLPQAEVGDFGDVIRGLRERGFQRSGRHHLSVVDLEEPSIRSIAAYWHDDRPRESNRNDSGPGYSRVDSTAPYSRTWKPPKRGTFTSLARVTTQEGSTAEASPVTIWVKAKKR